MTHKKLTALFAAASLSFSVGCVSSLPTMLTRTKANEASADGSGAFETSWLKKKSAEKELSPEFKAAQKGFKNPEKSLLAWAQYQENIGEYGEARKKYHELQVAYSDNIDAAMGLARIEMLTGRSQQAEEQLTRLAKKYPSNQNIQLELGSMYASRNDMTNAIRSYERACEIAPNDQTCRYELGVALIKSAEFDEGLAHLSYSVGESAAHYNIGYILHEQGNDADAVEWFRNALELHPDKQTAERTRAMLANLAPSAEEAASEMIAQRSANRRRAAAMNPGSSAQPLIVQKDAVPGSAATGSAAATFSPAGFSTAGFSSMPSRNVGQPMMASGVAMPPVASFTQPQGRPLPPAIESQVLPPVNEGPGGMQQQSFRAVSYQNSSPTTSLSPSSAIHTTGSAGQTVPPEWNGPSHPQTTNTNGGPQNPPAWRAYSGQ